MSQDELAKKMDMQGEVIGRRKIESRFHNLFRRYFFALRGEQKSRAQHDRHGTEGFQNQKSIREVNTIKKARNNPGLLSFFSINLDQFQVILSNHKPLE